MVFTLGQLVVLQKFEKILLRNGKTIRKNICSHKIYHNIEKDHKKYMRLTSNQEFSKFTKEKLIEKLLENGDARMRMVSRRLRLVIKKREAVQFMLTISKTFLLHLEKRYYLFKTELKK